KGEPNDQFQHRSCRPHRRQGRRTQLQPRPDPAHLSRLRTRTSRRSLAMKRLLMSVLGLDGEPKRRSAGRVRPRLEALEDRNLPTPLSVPSNVVQSPSRTPSVAILPSSYVLLLPERPSSASRI